MNLISDERPTDGEEGGEDKDAEEVLWKDTPRELAGKRTNDVSLDLEDHRGMSMEAEDKRAEEMYKDSLNVTPEVADVPPRPDSLEPEEDEREKSRNADGDAVRSNTFDHLKDRLIEIEMAERNIEKALAGQQTATCNDEATSKVDEPTIVEKMDEARKSSSEAEETANKSTSEREIEEKKSINEKEKVEESVDKEGKENDNVEKSTNEERKAINEGEEKLTREVEKESSNVENLTNERELQNEERKAISKEKEEFTSEEKESDNVKKSTDERGTSNEKRKSITEEKEESTKEVEKESNNVEKLTSEIGISDEERKSTNKEEEKSTNEVEKENDIVKRSTSETENSMEMKVTTEQAEPSTVANEELIQEKGSKDQVKMSTNEAEKVPNGVEEIMIKRHVSHLESANIPRIKNDQFAEASVHEKDDKGNATTSTNGKAITTDVSTTGSGNTGTVDELERHLRASLPASGSDIGRSKTRKKRETNEAPVTRPQSLKIPFSYVLSEGSPCEIPDSVTTVIIPDRPCPSPVIPEIEDHQPGSTYHTIGKTNKEYYINIV